MTAGAPARALLSGLIDYAGLFPPAALSMDMAVRQYAAYRVGNASWMLGRFVVRADQLSDFARSVTPHLTASSGTWRISALLGSEPRAGVDVVMAFNAAHRPAQCDCVEASAAAPDEVAHIGAALHATGLTGYVEIGVRDDPKPMIEAIAAHRLRAKIRTGGTTLGAFPSTSDVLRFIATCARAGVPFKATAGLHHPLRGDYVLTYDENSPRGTMHGFLNVFLAAALLRDGGDARTAEALMTERSASAFTFASDGVHWRNVRFLTPRLTQLRDGVACSFGSCSFAEPVEALRALKWL